jgi:uncharacterized protein (TIGR04141 family)
MVLKLTLICYTKPSPVLREDSLSREKTNRIVIYQAKPEVTFDELDFATRRYTLEFADVNRKLFLQRNKLSKPSWGPYVMPLLPAGSPEINNFSCSFILVIRHSASNYIICGGSGFTEIQEHITDDFGLELALRMIDEKEISTINQKAMKGTTRQIIRAVSGYEPLFDRDNYNRILNMIEGKADFEGRKFRVIGKSSLVLRTAKDINHVGEVLDQVEAILAKEVKVHFPKSYKAVKDAATINQLEALMLAGIQAYWQGQTGREHIYLEFKDPFSQFRCETFNVTYRHHRAEVAEFDLDIIRQKFIAKGFTTIDSMDDLHKMHVTGFNADGRPEIKKEPVYNLLVFETTIGNIHYIKMGKQWLQILEEVHTFINEELRKLTVHNDRLPDWNRAQHTTELAYNQHTAVQKGWTCMDQQFIHLPGRSKIEFCDLYDHAEKTFYHVKETWGCKSAYLFTQGITAAETYRQSMLFKTKCAEKWPQFFTENIENPKLVFGIADPKSLEASFPRNMSYFAKLNLYNAVSVLKNYEFEVALAPIRLA